MLTIIFPNINPYIVRFGDLGITWYSLAYVAGILFAWKYASYIVKTTNSKITNSNLDDLVTYSILGIVIGGRLGHIILYDPVYFIENPIEILQTYKGGMSFHGGLLGVVISSLYYCKKNKIQFFSLMDILALVCPVGIMLGRVANFINGELYGDYTDLPWGVVFPYAGDIPRHPSQIYEAICEGLLLFVVINYLGLRKSYINYSGAISGCFLICYSLARIFCEIFRIPDFEILGISAGQLYSIPMLFFGSYLILTRYGNKKYHI